MTKPANSDRSTVGAGGKAGDERRHGGLPLGDSADSQVKGQEKAAVTVIQREVAFGS